MNNTFLYVMIKNSQTDAYNLFCQSLSENLFSQSAHLNLQKVIFKHAPEVFISKQKSGKAPVSIAKSDKQWKQGSSFYEGEIATCRYRIN